MEKNELFVKVAACLTTLAETNGSPESLLYMGLCNSNMNTWIYLRGILTSANFVTIKSNWVTLTPLGIETAKKLEAVIR